MNVRLQSAMTLAVLAALATVSTEAHAYGAFAGPSPEVVRALEDEVVFVDGPGPEMTAIVRVRVGRTTRPFAWLIPFPGKPRMALSSSVVLRRLSEATAPEHLLEVAVSGTCKAAPDSPPAAKSVAAQPSHRLEADATWIDLAALPAGEAEGALARWLTSGGFSPDAVDGEAVRQLAADGYGVHALRLSPAENAEYTPAIALAYEATRPSLPRRLARTPSTTDVVFRVWVVGPSQTVPRGVPSLVLNEARIDWTSGVTYASGTLPANGAGLPASEVREPTNYGELVRAAATEAGGTGFVTELAGTAGYVRQSVWSKTDDERVTELSRRKYANGAEAVTAAHELLGDWGDASVAASTTGAAAFLRLLRTRVVGPVSNAADMLRRAPYLTRLYGVTRAGTVQPDVAFDYNADLAQVPKARMAHQRVQCDAATTRREAPWRIDLAHGGSIAGSGPGVPASMEAAPANLRVVTLSTTGSGVVVKDNRAAIESRLLRAASADPPPPTRLGRVIGGDRTLQPAEQPLPPRKANEPAAAPDRETATGPRCSVGRGDPPRDGGIAGVTALAAALLFSRRRRAALLVVLGSLSACTGKEHRDEPGAARQVPPPAIVASASPDTLPAQSLEDPKSCKPCHPMHYREWSGSMHAYATDDPVFVAMNARGQRETDGKLGDFCFRCHAPMAVRRGFASAQTDPRTLPDGQRGVTCYFCHNVTAVEGDHNGQLRIAGDDVIRGPIKDPARTTAHRTEFSPLFDEFGRESSAMCGGCHDIVTPNGVELERTFREYRHGIFSKSATGEAPAFDSCVGCHMFGERGFAAAGKGLPERTVHKHFWPGVDAALTDFPHREAMRSAVERCELPASIAFFTLEVTPPDLFTFQIETNAGHNQPSGASQDRRMWLEVLAYDAKGKLLENVSSGRIGDGELEEHPPGHAQHDPNLLLFTDRIFDAQGKPVHMFWEAEKSMQHPRGFESNLLPAANVTYLPGRHAILKQYRISGPEGLPARVTARLRLRPIGMDVLRDLVASGDLEESVLAQMPTYDFGHRLEWTPKKGVMRPIPATLAKANCEEFKCLLEPGSKFCDRSTAPGPQGPRTPRSPLDPYGY